jgi:hypothetical protein
VPLSLVEKKGSKIFVRFSGGMPQPVSAISILTMARLGSDRLLMLTRPF